MLKLWNKLKYVEKGESFQVFLEKNIPLSTAKIILKQLEIKDSRYKYLNESDWIMLSDAPVSTEGRKLYREYRQYLRDLPSIWQNKQILEYKVMKFDDWKENKPIYKSEKKVII